ncbi:type 2 isopentenyl-diphosphate Delta-isomerase [Effusibacillus consociatus]|uniref:Isopentenyl-diphosphate delta-isomerase n=1 Tax=Effusibacillus consociatus TaxID=1117041 RepID=A0ABV9Q3N9_9BACL
MSRENRKLDHVRLALSSEAVQISDFDDLHFVHQSLPEVGLEDIRLDTQIGELVLSSPIFINAMTGGAISTKDINQGLAEVARETGVAMAVGSQRAALANPELIDTYRIVRQINPKGVVIANLGAGASVEDAKQAVEMIEADLLQLHLNVPQEVVMPEGDRDFKGILEAIQRVADEAPVPVIVKEVGFGMCRETYEQLKSIGVKIVDVGGRGGTNFISIENQRRSRQEYSHLSGWGQSTAISLLEADGFSDLEFIASGGVRNSLDVAKCLALGAKGVGVAGPILRIFSEQGIEGAVQVIESWHEQLRAVMTLLGAQSLAELKKVPVVIMGRTKEWCELRGIDIRQLAVRYKGR